MYSKKILTALILFVCLKAGHAAVTVGACQPKQHSYPTISAAITAAHSGDIVQVCPGTYPEQLTITKSLTIEGIVVAHQSGATITPPAAGLVAIPAGSSFYPQVFINTAGAPVSFFNLSIDGTNASILYGKIVFDITSACQVGFLKDFSGLYFLHTPGVVQNVNVSGHFATSVAPDNNGPQQYPNCGSGIEFNNTHQPAFVQDTVVNGFGLYGIYSTGKLNAEHNAITASQSGPYQVGIMASTEARILGNAISGGAFIQSTGIQGGNEVRNNIVQSWTLGIVQSKNIMENTLLNNSIGLSGVENASKNLITAPAQYIDPACTSGGCLPGNTYKPTVGIDFKCVDDTNAQNNGVVGVGIGFANLKKNETLSSSNLFASVQTPSTTCTQ